VEVHLRDSLILNRFYYVAVKNKIDIFRIKLEPSDAKYSILYYTGGLKAQAERFHSKEGISIPWALIFED